MHAPSYIGPFRVVRPLAEVAGGDRFMVQTSEGQPRHACVIATNAADAAMSALRGSIGVDHPNLLGILDVLPADSGVAVISEAFDGLPLTSLVGGLDFPDAMDVFYDILQGMAALHEAGAYHHGLDPSAIFVGVYDYGGRIAKVGGYGLGPARRLGGAGPRAAMQSPYAAPELITDIAQADGRADIFSLGAILYHLLTGAAPFEGEASTMLKAKAARHYVPVRQHNPKVPEYVAAAVSRAMSPIADHRFSSILSLGQALFPDFQIHRAESGVDELEDTFPQDLVERTTTQVPPGRVAGPQHEINLLSPVNVPGPLAVVLLVVGLLLTFTLVTMNDATGLHAAAATSQVRYAAVEASLEAYPDIVVDLTAAGGDERALTVAADRYERAYGHDRLIAGRSLQQTMENELLRLNSTSDLEQAGLRNRLDHQLQRVDRAYEGYVHSLRSWEESASSFRGWMLISLGMADSPPEGLADRIAD